MSNGGIIHFDCDFTQAQRKLMLRAVRVGREDVMRTAGNVMKGRIDPYIPKNTGKLRASARVRVSPYRFSINWGNGKAGDYAHYQYVGRVWGPNIYNKKAGTWFSRAPKHPTNRFMGDGTDIVDKKGNVIYTRKYTWAGTGPEWDKAFRADTSAYRNYRQWLTKYLKKVWKNGET